MKLSDLNTAFAAPIFYFLGVILYIFAGLGLWATVFKSTVYIVLSCLLFVLAYNAFRIGNKIRVDG